MGVMNNITKTLKETFKPRKRRAAIGGILGPIMIVVIVIAGVGVLAAMFFDLADTTSIVESIDISSPAVYSDQGYVTVQVKNNGNTAIEDVYATLLVVDNAGGDNAKCKPGVQPMLINRSVGNMTATAIVVTDLNPGESTTISGGLRDSGAVSVSAAGATTVAGAGTALSCAGGTPTTGSLEDRGEYILRISGHSDGDVISKTITVRAR